MYVAIKNNNEWICTEFSDCSDIECTEYIEHWISDGFPVAIFQSLDDMQEWGINPLDVRF